MGLGTRIRLIVPTKKRLNCNADLNRSIHAGVLPEATKVRPSPGAAMFEHLASLEFLPQSSDQWVPFLAAFRFGQHACHGTDVVFSFSMIVGLPRPFGRKVRIFRTESFGKLNG